MQDIKHYDILWVDDFDKGEQFNNPRKYLKDYFPAEFRFRVRIEKNFFNALVHLENHFTNYSCVVLDVNFIRGFNFGESDDEDKISREIFDGLKSKNIRFEDGETVKFGDLEIDEKNTLKEAVTLCRLYDIFKSNNILIDGALDAENLFDAKIIDYKKITELIEAFERDVGDFKKNAGYYLFLYLLQRGMPQKNIAMLTGNKGETSVRWQKKFREANLQSPKAFDRVQCALTKRNQTSEFVDWLKSVFSPPYRLRACMVAMTAVLQKILDDDIEKTRMTCGSMWSEKDSDGDNRSSAVRNFHPEYIPLRLSEEADEILLPFISQIIAPWDKSTLPDKSAEYPYFATMKTARNWLAHRIIRKLTLQAECFLFGICMRGLFNLSDSDTSAATEYRNWEDELLRLTKKLDGNYPSCIDEMSTLVVSSSEELRTRSDYEKNFAHKDREKFIHNVLHFMGNHANSIKCCEGDLLRAFLHGVYGDIPQGYFPPGFNGYAGNLSEDTRGKYLDAIKNKLKAAVADAEKFSRED